MEKRERKNITSQLSVKKYLSLLECVLSDARELNVSPIFWNDKVLKRERERERKNEDTRQSKSMKTHARHKFS
jgi:hypothetical protein